MITKPRVASLLAAGCISAAAGGAYVAVRQNSGGAAAAEAASVQSAEPLAVPAVAETEGIVTPAPASGTPLVAPSSPPAAGLEPETEQAVQPAPSRPARSVAVESRTVRADPVPAPVRARPAPRVARDVPASPSSAAPATNPPATVLPAALPPAGPVSAEVPAALEVLPPLPEREFIQVVVPASSVIGLQMETALTSERARVEDRVDARVTRDVMADGRVAIPAGSRVIGSVTLVERGGKIKERARLGVRFHTLVFADGSEQPIRTEAIYREGDSPSGDSAKKIGGAAVGGAILGAIIGGGKGAMIGGAAGAAGGTAATMAGDRNAATLPAGAVVTVRLTEPITLDLEKYQREF
jgi:type IV secretory pathway VirB10-like protein